MTVCSHLVVATLSTGLLLNDRSETGEKDLIYSVPEQQSVHLPVEDPETDLEPKQAPSARHTG